MGSGLELQASESNHVLRDFDAYAVVIGAMDASDEQFLMSIL